MSDKTVVFWGAGRRLTGFIQEFCIEKKYLPLPDYISDSTRNIEEKHISGVPVISFDQVKRMKPADTIIIITAGLLDLQAQVVRNELYYFPLYFSRSFDTYFYLREYENVYQKSIQLLADDKSKMVYRACLEGMINGSLWNQQIFDPHPYFGNDVVGELKEQDHVVFAGAFNGKHIDRMLLSHPKVGVDACEPSRYWYQYLKKKYQDHPKIQLHNKILWDCKESLQFQEDASNAGLDAHVCARDGHSDTKDSHVVESIEIDNLVCGKRVSLIALDVEGSEQRALRGAQQVILKDKPKLTICLYHSVDDFIRIPLLIDELGQGGYRFFVKQHSCISAIETVLYAI